MTFEKYQKEVREQATGNLGKELSRKKEQMQRPLNLSMYLACSTISKKAKVTGRKCIRGRKVGNEVRKMSRNQIIQDLIDYSKDSSFY